MGIKVPVDLDVIYRPIEAEMTRLDAFLRDEFQAEEPFIHELLEHVAGFGGKRLRPALPCAACEAFGGTDAAGLAAGTAVELVHAYSLVHDDLPCMDDDDLRRGRATCHRVYGEAMAVLVGDALLPAAFRAVSEWPGAVHALARAACDAVQVVHADRPALLRDQVNRSSGSI